nr:hypothetical protein Iba_chr14aCG1150 [Ipomoea batatas]
MVRDGEMEPVRLYWFPSTSKHKPTIPSMIDRRIEVCVVSYCNREKHLHLVHWNKRFLPQVCIVA